MYFLFLFHLSFTVMIALFFKLVSAIIPLRTFLLPLSCCEKKSLEFSSANSENNVLCAFGIRHYLVVVVVVVVVAQISYSLSGQNASWKQDFALCVCVCVCVCVVLLGDG